MAPALDAKHFCCALSAVAVARVRQHGGEEATADLLREAASPRTVAHLEDIGNWIGFDEMIALWEAGARVTGDPGFARSCGADAVRRLGGSSTSTILRMLGSPEEVLRKTTVAGRRFSVCADLDPVEVRAGYAEVRARAAPGFTRHRAHCEWAQGLYTTIPVLFGLAPASVEHPMCQLDGAEECRYVLRWEPARAKDADPAEEAARLRGQLAAMTDRLESVFATASDLIASSDLDDVLGRITDRAALQVRAPRYLLAVRPTEEDRIRWYQRGLGEDEAAAAAERILDPGDEPLPSCWLVSEVASHRTHYGSLAAMFSEGEDFLPAERQLLDLYARYAATALDSAAGLREAHRRQEEAQARYQETRALLELARRLATADDSPTVARRLADAVPAVIDCDRAAVFLWDETTQELVRAGLFAREAAPEVEDLVRLRAAELPLLAELAARPSPEPMFEAVEDSPLRAALHDLGAVASVAVPIVTPSLLLGCLIVSVTSGPERLAATPELRDRLSGVAAHAVVALENGRLVDHITHQASHDQLTGLVNRAGFRGRYAAATERGTGESVALFYLDLDGFKSINDEFGHDVGDRLLQAVATRVAELVRPGDTVARLGGDEFVVLVEAEADGPALDMLAERLRGAFRAPFAVGDHSLELDASIGRAVWPDEVADRHELLRTADQAMYAAKRVRRARRARPVRAGRQMI